MKLSVLVWALLLSQAFASVDFVDLSKEEADESIITRIVEIKEAIYKVTDRKYHAIYAADGYVYRIDEDDHDLLDLAREAKEKNYNIVIKLGAFAGLRDNLFDKSSEIKEIGFYSKVNLTEEEAFRIKSFNALDENKSTSALKDYEVSVLENYAQADRYFATMKRDTRRRSQCYNRAHFWSYKLKQRFGLNTGKMWIFFTSKYIDEYDYKWWFHVAPYIKIKNAVEPIVLDRKFSHEPQGRTEWKNDYMYGDKPCPIVEKYTDYRKNQFSNWCYLLQSSMYYWQPFNLENLEKDGTEKRGFVDSELRQAFKDITSFFNRDWDEF